MLHDVDTLKKCLEAIQNLSNSNQVLLEWLLKLLSAVGRCTAQNKMTPANLCNSYKLYLFTIQLLLLPQIFSMHGTFRIFNKEIC